MGNTKTVIELNGKQYDVASGKPVTAAVKHAAAKKPAPPASSGHNMDGFFRKPPVDRGQQSPLRAHKPQKAGTLMRHIVKKPAAPEPSKIKPLAKRKPAPKSTLPAVTRPNEVWHVREKRADAIHKSPLISRFGEAGTPTISKKIEHVPVRPAPPLSATERPVHQSVAAIHKHPSGKHDPFAHALHHATSHQQPRHAKSKLRHRAAHKLGVSSRILNAGAAGLAVILLVGFVAYQNVPNFALRIASGRAGFQASMPAYQPSGFALTSPIEAAAGVITLQFRSNTDHRTFNVSQRASNWTSQSLLASYVAPTGKPYQTYSDKGKTIYLYNNSSATWVNGGIWYQVEGASNLNTEQLLRLANSM